MKKKTQKPLTSEQQEQLKEQLLNLSNISPEEVQASIKEHPDSVIAAQACCNMLFDEFFDKYLPVPTRGDMSDEDYHAQVQSYQNIRESVRQIAAYWYVAGTNHKKHIARALEILENQPEGNPS